VEVFGASAIVRQQISIPRSNGDYPRGNHKPSAGIPPRDGRGAPSNAPRVTLAAVGSAYSTEASLVTPLAAP